MMVFLAYSLFTLINLSCHHAGKAQPLAANFANVRGFLFKFANISVIRGKKSLLEHFNFKVAT